MHIELTEEERRALETHPDQPVRVVDPQTQLPLVLLRADQYERLHGAQTNGAQVSQIPTEVPPGLRRSREAFFRDLPALLKQSRRRGQWVAYHGERRRGFARTEAELYQKLLRQGVSDRDFYVGWIGPQSEEPETVDPHLWEFVDIPGAIDDVDSPPAPVLSDGHQGRDPGRRG
jgi:hypothetical protein